MPDLSDTPFELKVFDREQWVRTISFTESLELGRQQMGEEEPYALRRDANGARLVIAHLREDDVSRRHVRLEPAPPARIRIVNLSAKQPVFLTGGAMVPPRSTQEVDLPCGFQIGARAIQIEAPESKSDDLQSLNGQTMAPGKMQLSRISPSALSAVPEAELETVFRALQGTLELMQTAATRSDFFPEAAKTVVELVGLDTSQVLLFKEGDWRVVAACSKDDSSTSPASQQVLRKLIDERRTFWQVVAPNVSITSSLSGIQSVVAAPILNQRGDVVGALYGDRRRTLFTQRITKLDALLVELLASSVAAGLARIEQEQAALAARVRFEQFFTPDLAQRLATQPELLQGQDAEISVIFVDVCGFSRIAERIGTEASLAWIHEVMTLVSAAILEESGVLVDYVGDATLAMWGAPTKQPNHAELACRAAIKMLCDLPLLSEKWMPILGEPIRLAVGINTGVARVGNVGSKQKFKYGPMGNTVNLASRIQGATKHFKTDLMIAHTTREQLPESYPARRLGKVRTVNIAAPVELYELVPHPSPNWLRLKQESEKALAEFERGEFRAATRMLGQLLTDYPHDGPALILLSRAVTELAADRPDFDPVWLLSGK